MCCMPSCTLAGRSPTPVVARYSPPPSPRGTTLVSPATTGVGLRAASVQLGMQHIRAGDALLVSGPVGDHGIAVMLAREQFGLRGELLSDAASVLPLTQALLKLGGLRFMRDPTRGGLATVAHEIAHATGLTVRLHETYIPVRDPVRAVCEILGYDAMFLACEGRVVAVVEAVSYTHLR